MPVKNGDDWLLDELKISRRWNHLLLKLHILNYAKIKNWKTNMARKSNSTMTVVSIALLIAGIGLAIWGYQISGSFGSQLNSAFNGSPTDKVMLLYIGGAVSFVIGLYLLVRK